MDVRRKSCEVAGREVRKVQLTIGTERDGGDWTEGSRQGRRAVRHRSGPPVTGDCPDDPRPVDHPYPTAVGKVEVTIGSERHSADVREFGPCRRTAVPSKARSPVTSHHPELAIGETDEDLVTCWVGHVERSGRTDSERASSSERDDRSDGHGR